NRHVFHGPHKQTRKILSSGFGTSAPRYSMILQRPPPNVMRLEPPIPPRSRSSGQQVSLVFVCHDNMVGTVSRYRKRMSFSLPWPPPIRISPKHSVPTGASSKTSSAE